MNFNDTIEITLNDYGKEILHKYEENYLKLLSDNNYASLNFKERTVDENNKIQLPLWEVANIFGSHLYVGRKEPFKMEFKIV